MPVCLKGYELGAPPRKRRRRRRGRAVLVEELDAGDAQAAAAAPLDDGQQGAAAAAAVQWAHGEMGVAEAQATRVVRVPRALSPKQVRQVLEVHGRLRGVCGVSNKKHGGGAQNWCTCFLHTDGIFSHALPKLRQKILDVAAAADEAQGWGLLSGAPSPPTIRCVELHTVGPGGALPQRKHFDTGSLITVDILLSPTSEFEGGTLTTLETDGTMLPQPFECGEARVFVSHKFHCVLPVTAGQRQVLIAEVWAGRERTCAHRCEHHDGVCPVSLALSRHGTIPVNCRSHQSY